MEATRELLRVFITCGPANGAISTRRWGAECEHLGIVQNEGRSRTLALALQPRPQGRPSLKEELLLADPPLPARVDFLRFWRAMERLMQQHDRVPRLDLEGSPFGRFEPGATLVGEMRKFRDSVLGIAAEHKGDLLPVPALEAVLLSQKEGSQDPSYWDEVGAHLPETGDLPLVEVAEAIFLWLSEYDCSTPRATPHRSPTGERTPLAAVDTNVQATPAMKKGKTPRSTPRWRGFDSPWRKVITGLEQEVKDLRTEVADRDDALKGLQDDCEELSSAIRALPEPVAATPNTKLGWKRVRYHAARVRGAEPPEDLVQQLHELEVAAAEKERELKAERQAAAERARELEAERQAAAERARELEAERVAAAERARELEAERVAAAERARELEAERVAAAERARELEAEREAKAGALATVRRLSAELESRELELEGLRESASPATPWADPLEPGPEPCSGDENRPTPPLPRGQRSPRKRRPKSPKKKRPSVEIYDRERAERRAARKRRIERERQGFEGTIEQAVLDCSVM